MATRGNRAGTNAFMEEMLAMNDLGGDEDDEDDDFGGFDTIPMRSRG